MIPARFKYYLVGLPGDRPEPMYALKLISGNSDVGMETLKTYGHPMPPTPDFKTWVDMVSSKKRCGRCWATTRGHQDLIHHNQAAHATEKIYIPS